ncbi:porin family protein [Winogradskyella algicola]|uniref:porin family protein n=1 Tax=Winogradskyella algicola TaxID=2575815 RepID=UPI001108F5FA|nr:porin family protein [Winogradskyella algicola]
MRFNLATKILIILAFGFQLNAQNDSIGQNKKKSKIPFLFDDERQYLGAMSLTYQNPMPYGDNFIGEGFEGKGGYNFKFQVYVFKNFFVGFSYGFSHFNNINTELLGSYTKSTLEEISGVLGYEFVPLPKVRLGVNASVFGNATLTNSIQSGYGNRDFGKLRNLGITFEYEFIRNLNVLLEYNWRKIKSEIEVPNELKSFFEEGTYNTLNIGLKFNFGNEAFVDKVFF